MKSNVGSIDRVLRIVLGLVLIGLMPPTPSACGAGSASCD